MDYKAPAFQFYANDFMGSTAAWSNEEVGIYMRLLCHKWVNGFIPPDEKRLSRIVSLGLDEFREAWSVVGEKFQQSGKDKLKNKRLEEVRRQQSEKREQMRRKGLKGANARWNRDKDGRVVPFNSEGSQYD